jgi:hypothetical protein
MRLRPLLRAALLALLAVPAVAAAQETPTEGVVDCGAAGGGTVTGVIQHPISEQAVRGVVIRTPGLPCGEVVTDAKGRFALRGVPEGLWLVTPDAVAGRRVVGIVRVHRNHSVNRVSMYDDRHDSLRRCRTQPACASFLAPDSAALTAGDGLRDAVARAAMVLAGALRSSRTYCIDAPPPVLEALRSRLPHRRVEAEGCAEVWPKEGRPRVMHRPSGTPAIHVSAGEPAERGDVAVASVGWANAPLSSAAYYCIFERAGDGWMARACFLSAIS